MSVYDAGVNAGRRSAVRFASDVVDLSARRARDPAELIGRAHLPRSPGRKKPGVLGPVVNAVLRLVLPVMLLLTVGVACVIYSDIPAEGLGTFAGKPLSLGLALVPVTFFVIHLTNRRYGATYAFAQVIAAWALGLLGLPTLLSMISLPEEIRALTGFGAGLFFAQIVAVVLFDGLRGPTWWKAPLFASLLGGLLLCVIAFPVSLGGTGMNWSKEMLSYMELVAGAAVLLLIPYGLLRSLVPPRPGYGGY